jgi:hypothetical protein
MSVTRFDTQHRVRVESQGGAGAIFRVTLPVTAAPVTTPDVTEPAVPPPITGKELLVIDDEVATVKALVAVCRRDGHHVELSATHTAAIATERSPHMAQWLGTQGEDYG